MPSPKSIIAVTMSAISVEAAAAFPATSSEAGLKLLQWNPHWQGWSSSSQFAPAVETEIKSLLQQGVDFANLVEVEPGDDFLTAGLQAIDYATISSTCGKDLTMIVYNTNKWKPQGEPQKGCLADPSDRPYVMQMFQSEADDSELVAVVGAHFPHGSGDYHTLLEPAFSALGANTDTKTVFMADTNVGSGVSDTFLMTTNFGFGADSVAGSGTTEITCCSNDGFHAGAYDRIVTANIGTVSTTYPDISATILDQSWFNADWEMHKPILASV